METKTKSAKIKDNPCWKGYKQLGTKTKGSKKVPDCVPVAKKNAMLKKYKYYKTKDQCL